MDEPIVVSQVHSNPVYTRIAVMRAPCPWHLVLQEDPAFLWREAGREEVWLGLGSLAEYASPEALRVALERVQCPELNVTPRGFGVVAFDPDCKPEALWHDFPAWRFVLPSCLIRWNAGVATVLVMTTEHAELSANVRRVTTMLQRPASGGTIDIGAMEEMSLFSREAWGQAVARVQHHIRHNLVRKAVLARQSVARLPHDVNSATLLEQLSMDAPESDVFAYRQRTGGVFLGATPERLFVQRRRQLTVDSLAGTRPRGTDAAEDQRLADELSHSAKDLLEQRLVTDHVVDQMQTLCEDVVIESAPRVRRLHAVQHLSTTVEGTIRDSVTLDHILSALHPTPATCGVPIASARELIAEIEPEPRGLYAGVIGWVGVEQARFSVGIRSCLVRGNEVRLFAGAGIMADSDADAEFDECEWKLRPLRHALRKMLA
jgi:menaquinone-specific isochorismate synthase